uniref:Uncharacterized protein n=1 Tax=Anguilla anguilla TaxID=7936 RepID=A0A0E9SA77_ANGAN
MAPALSPVLPTVASRPYVPKTMRCASASEEER